MTGGKLTLSDCTRRVLVEKSLVRFVRGSHMAGTLASRWHKLVAKLVPRVFTSGREIVCLAMLLSVHFLLAHAIAWDGTPPLRAIATAPRVSSPCMLGAKNKKSSFVPYNIDGESTPLFPLPAERSAVGVHKKHYPNGVLAGKAAKSGALDGLPPGLDYNWPGLRVLHLDPPVVIIEDFFSAEECDDYAALREGDPALVHELAQSATFSGATNDARTSTTWFLAYQAVPTFLARAAALLGVDDIRRFEEPQLVRYAPGQYFNWHYDAVPPTLLNNGGQRVATLLVYLNDVPGGGRTAFRDLRAGGTDAGGKPLRLAVAPKKGRAILFFPATGDGVPDERTLHAGEPTHAGEDKWIAQLWTHEGPYSPTAPATTSHEEASEAVREFARANGLRAPATPAAAAAGAS